jgi:hypothetical protein
VGQFGKLILFGQTLAQARWRQVGQGRRHGAATPEAADIDRQQGASFDGRQSAGAMAAIDHVHPRPPLRPGADPVERLTTAFRTCCLVVDAKRAAVNLTYRQSKTLSSEGLSQIKSLEFETAEPIRQVYRDGVTAGAFLDIDARLVAHNILLTAHGWALKHWNLASWLSLDEYIEQELAMLLASVRADRSEVHVPVEG